MSITAERPPDVDQLRVVVCDDHPTILMAVTQVLEGAVGGPPLAVVATHDTPESLLAGRARAAADVVVLDVTMGGGADEHGGLRIAADLQDHDPATKVLFYSGVVDSRVVRQALTDGACGYLDKTVPPTVLVDAVRRVGAGERPVLDAGTATRLAMDVMDHGEDVALSAREQEVLENVASGRTNVQIGARLGISENTVKSLLRRALDKLDTPDRASAVAEAFRRGLLR